MKKYYIFTLILSIVSLYSCIKEEALNSEADIIKCILPKEILTNKYINYNPPFNQKLNGYQLNIEVNDKALIESLSPTFELTPGSTIEPGNGTTHDFSKPIVYTVTSQDKKWKRNYIINISYSTKKTIPTFFDFETVDTSLNYYTFYQTAHGCDSLVWGSGNQGFSITGFGIKKENYPTVISKEGYSGNCLKLVTKKTGSLGALAKKPIAAGNLFIGSFELSNAMGDALSATKFGHTFYYKPLRLTGYYKYKSGPKYYENGIYIDKKDIFNLYGLFFEKSESINMLDGHIAVDNYENDNMVALAIIKDAKECDEWTYFDIPFDYDKYGKEVNLSKLIQGKYSISIVMSSSINGDSFKGAPESTLLIDNLRIVY